MAVKHVTLRRMSDGATKHLTVEEFIVWAEGREEKWELHDGVVVAMAPERARHSLVKAYAIAALVNAIGRAKGLAGSMPMVWPSP
jgi:Uma2 family endonuclease